MLFLWTFTMMAALISFRNDKERTLHALSKSIKSLKRLSPGLLGMIAAVGFVLAAIPTDTLATLFKIKGIEGYALVSLIGAVITVPGPVAFPLAGSILQMGASPAVLASFITTLTMVSLLSSPLEISYFGKRFTLMRQLSSFLSAIFIGLLMGFFL